MKTNAIALMMLTAIACAVPAAAYDAPDVTVKLPTTTVIQATFSGAYGAPAQFQASVSGNTSRAAVSGNIVFSLNGTAQATVALKNGTASWATSSLMSAGSATVTAAYGGDSMFASSSGSVSLYVLPAQTSTALSDPNNPSVFSQVPVVTVTVDDISGVPPPAGTIQLDFVYNGFSAAGSLVAGSGAASTSSIPLPASLAPGTYVIGAIYTPGANDFMGSNTETINHVINKASASVTVSSNPAAPKTGQPATLTATVTCVPPATAPPTGTVALSDGATSLGTVTLASGAGCSSSGSQSATFTTAGAHAIAAVYSGAPGFTGTVYSYPQTVTSSSSGSTSTSLISSANPATFGQSVTFTATVTGSGGTPTGVVTFWDGTTELGNFALNGNQASLATSALSVGAHSITAVYGGDGNFSGSTSPVLTQNVSSAAVSATQTSLSSSLNPSILGQPVTFTATVSSSGSAIPTGNVAFKDGATTLVTVSLSNGSATFQDPSLTAGTHSMTAVYAGDSSHSGSTSAVLAEVVNSSLVPTTTSLSSSTNPSTPGQAVTFTAVVSSSSPGTPTGFITWWDGTTELGSMALNGNRASLATSTLSVGAHSITAGYGGDIAFAPSTSAVLVQQVSTAPATSATTTSLVSSANPSTAGDAVTFTATVTPSGSGTPTGAVIFADGGSTIASVALNGGRASFTTSSLAVGAHTITAAYAGDANFSASTSTILDQTVESAVSTTPAATYYFPHLAFGGGWQTTLTYVNYGPQSVSCRTTFYSDSGAPLNVPFTDGTNSVRTDSLAGGADIHVQTQPGTDPTPLTGWAEAQCTGAVKASLLYRLIANGVAQGEAGVNAMSAPATEFVSFAQTNTGLAYANPSAQPASVTVTVLDANGNQLGSKTVELQPNQHASANVGPLLGLTSFTGSVQITSTQPIAALLLNAEAYPVFSSLPAADLPAGTPLAGTWSNAPGAGATTYYFPHLAFGGGWQTTLTYVNYSPQSVTCQTVFYSDAGDPLNVPFADGSSSSRTDNLAGGADVHVETQSPDSAAVFTGWAKAECSGPVKASLLYRLIEGGVAQGEAGVNAMNTPATEFASFAQTNTGIAYANPSAQPADVTLTVLDASGNKLGSKSVTLAPNQHASANLGPLLGLGSFTGSVEIVVTEPIVAVLLNAEAYPVFSSLPPADLPPQTSLAGGN